MTQPEASYDVICEPLTCPNCGERSATPIDQDLQTKLARGKSVRCFRLGDAIDVVASPVEEWGYYSLEDRAEATPTRSEQTFLETWDCPSCGANLLWALVTIRDGKLASVESVPLTRDVLAHADYISGAAAMLFDSERIRDLPRLTARDLRLAIEEAATAQ